MEWLCAGLGFLVGVAAMGYAVREWLNSFNLQGELIRRVVVKTKE